MLDPKPVSLREQLRAMTLNEDERLTTFENEDVGKWVSGKRNFESGIFAANFHACTCMKIFNWLFNY